MPTASQDEEIAESRPLFTVEGGQQRPAAVEVVGQLRPARMDDDPLVGEEEAALRLVGQIGRAHVLTPVTNAHLVCRLLLEKTKTVSPKSPISTARPHTPLSVHSAVLPT